MSAVRRVAITGMGCVSALGQGVEATWAATVAGRGGIKPMSRRYADNPAYAYAGPAATVQGLDLSPVADRFAPKGLAHLDPVAEFAVAATHEALSQAGLIDAPVLKGRTAIVYGSGSGGNAAVEESYGRLFDRKAGSVHPMSIPRYMVSAATSHLSMIFGVTGPAFTIASACASSAHAIAEGMHMIRSGRADVAIVGGAEAPITYASWQGWKALRAMASDTCRPFSKDRTGMVLGEGAATLILESFEHAAARGAEMLGEVAGEGASSDAFHITQPSGGGAVAALRAAHESAGLPLETPMLVSAHGTGTAANDETEARALNAVYGEGMGRNLVIATKSAHGHLIGAGGALEFLIGVLAIQRRLAPPVLNFVEADPACAVPLALGEAQPIAYEALISNAFAFGGLNSVLVARRV